MLKVVHNDVEVEPELKPILTEKLDGPTGDNACPDIRARGVAMKAWTKRLFRCSVN